MDNIIIYYYIMLQYARIVRLKYSRLSSRAVELFVINNVRLYNNIWHTRDIVEPAVKMV